jgi:hypothetical protein
MAVLVAAIHVFVPLRSKAWMAGTSLNKSGHDSGGTTKTKPGQ